jgi:hypothetical protein
MTKLPQVNISRPVSSIKSFHDTSVILLFNIAAKTILVDCPYIFHDTVDTNMNYVNLPSTILQFHQSAGVFRTTSKNFSRILFNYFNFLQL